MSYDIGLFVMSLIIIIIAYIYLIKLPKFDAFILLLACGILGFYYQQTSFKTKETFQNTGTVTTTASSTASTTNALVQLEEDLSPIKKNATIYLTSFNSKSFDGKGRIWRNVADPILIKNFCAQPSSSATTTSINFEFDSEPVYTRSTGINMNTQGIIGPLSCSLGIQFHTTYSIVIAFKPKDLTLATSSVIEIFKLFANSPNNNGISLTIPQKSIKSIANGAYTTTGLVLSVADKNYVCTQASSIDIPIEQDLLCIYFIVKDTDNVRIIYMNEKTKNQTILLSIKNPELFGNKNINFSNKEAIINSTKNWNVDLLTFGIFNAAFSTEQIGDLYNHTLQIYKKNKDEQYAKMAQTYNSLLQDVKQLQACPYDESTCNACLDVKDWKNTVGVLTTATTTCKKSINDYCSKNTTDSKCGGCWDSKNVAFNSDACKLTRTLLGNPDNIQGTLFSSLTPKEVEDLKAKLSLISPNDCPKPPPSTAMHAPSDGKIRDFYPEGKKADVVGVSMSGTGGEVDEDELAKITGGEKTKGGFWNRLVAAFGG